jgi:hypothetical protein
MAKPYKPERAVTSEKIKKDLDQLLNERPQDPLYYLWHFPVWKRIFRKGLPETKSQVRGYVGSGSNSGISKYWAGIAISDAKDTVMQKIYLLDGESASETEAKQAVKEELHKLGVLEVMFSDD